MKVTRTRLAAVGLIAAAAIAGSRSAHVTSSPPDAELDWSPTAPTSPCRRPSQGRRPSTWAGL